MLGIVRYCYVFYITMLCFVRYC